ncbi:transcription factor GAGA-like [Homarus americanus]|uniref:transcription factor GAGA-like n=1 Tax=Homarus americanus TaxID=6706 RepID=UPI001C43A2B7|nr:transcription factor GAGA-like [Homarus americanus]
MRKKRSGVWRHFQEEGDRKVSCRMCRMQLTKHGNTSMMLRHLRRKHPEMMDGLFDTEAPTVTEEESWQAEEQPLGKDPQPYLGSVKRKRSLVWQHFQEKGRDRVSCRLCHDELATQHGNTSSMRRHLHGKHPHIKLSALEGDSPRKMNHLHLRSSNTETRFLSVCERLLQHNHLTDCTLMAEGHFIQAHRLVLATCSESFEELFKTMTHPNPIIVLRDVTLQELQGLINYMYKGQILVKSRDLPGLLKAASQLKIKGLSEVGLSKTWPDDLHVPEGSWQQQGTSTTTTRKAGKTYFQDDQDMDDLEEEYFTPHQTEHTAQGQRTTYEMPSEEVVEPQNMSPHCHEDVPEAKTRMKKVQIKVEHDTDVEESHFQTSLEIPSPIDAHVHQQPEELDAEMITAQEEGDPVDPLVTYEINNCDGTAQVTGSVTHGQGDDNPLAQRSSDPVRQGTPGTSTTVLKVGARHHTSTPLPTLVARRGVGATGGKTQIRISTAGTSRAAPQPLRLMTLSPSRKFSKRDLLAAVNLVQDGCLGVKVASQTANTTIFRSCKTPDNPALVKQELDCPPEKVIKKSHE